MKLKYLVVGFIAGMLATLTISAGASTVYEKFTAVARPDYQLVVDGEKITLNTPPKTIEGVAYLPIREVAALLDKKVAFDSETLTISLDSIVVEESEYVYVLGSDGNIIKIKVDDLITPPAP